MAAMTDDVAGNAPAGPSIFHPNPFARVQVATVKSQRNAAFDGLRGVALLMVIAIHCGILVGGFYGVDVFFVLSGYLITGILLQRPRLGDFYIGRVRRLTPALLAMLAAYVLIAPFLDPAQFGHFKRDAFYALTYATDYSPTLPTEANPLGHTWSLAVEAQFYLIWPFVIGLIARLPRPQLAVILLVTYLGLWAWRLETAFLHQADWSPSFYPAHVHATGLVLGAALALFPLNLSPLTERLGLIGALLLALLAATPALDTAHYHGTFVGIAAAELATAAILPALAYPTGLARVFAWEPLRRFGLISYAVYLWHMPITYALSTAPPYAKFIVTVVISTALAAISYATVERWGKAALRRPAIGAASPGI
jgi:peptidoglycan/LPS O-acetylase OafA/YrhL